LLSYRISSKKEKELVQQLFKPGVGCTAVGTLEHPDSARNENSFDYRNYLHSRAVYWVFEADSIQLTSCKATQSSLVTAIQNWRSEGIDHIKKVFPASLHGTAAALLFGDRSQEDGEIIQAYQKLGIVHLLAISGLHVGMIFSFLYYVLLRLGLTKERTNAVLLLVLPVYAVLAGGSPPVVRAVFMTLLVLLSLRFQKKITALDALSVSFLIVLLVNPYLIYNVGFQLSYTVSFAIILSSSTIISSFHTSFGKMFAVTTISQIASLPIIIYHFFEFSILAFLANLLFVPFYSFFLLPYLLVLFLMTSIVPSFNLLLYPVAFILEKVNQLAVKAGSLPFATLITGRPGEYFLLLYIAAVAVTFLMWEKGKGLNWSAVPILLVLTSHILLETYSPKGEVSFIDVGQGDAIIIDLPYNNGIYVIDTGGVMPFQKEEWQKRSSSFSVGSDILLPHLKSNGITRIDKLILTHSDYDHIGAAEELIEGIQVKEVIISPGSEKKEVMKRVVKTAHREKAIVKYGAAGQQWREGDAEFQLIYPADFDYEGNNDSLVLFAKLGGLAWLFTGDLEEEGEKTIITTFEIRADVLKIGHHGSRTSTSEEFLKEIHPKVAVISAGRNNRFGHPHVEVVERLSRNGVRIYRTDGHGEISYKYTGQKGTFFTQFP
ncbi:MAG TPA: DNA internalization-related competence protein ComEC/Rec2, partial [Chondromyces sp.]|nr:DNA internalization-related competence protein ComEC/Rec2 [Chondromyces sp.]